MRVVLLPYFLLVAHFVGDYVLQSDWMAAEKTKRWWPAAAHGFAYTLPFAALFLLVFGATPRVAIALAIVGVTHTVIDRLRLAKRVVWAKNFLAPRVTTEVTHHETHVAVTGVPLFEERTRVYQWWFPWSECEGTGYHKEKPPWLAVWLLIWGDNAIHLLLNGLAALLLVP